MSVPTSELVTPNPSPASQCAPCTGGGEGGVHTRLRVTEVGGVPVWTTEKKLSTLSTLWLSPFAFAGSVHIGARVLLDPNLTWFGYITPLSQWGGGGYFTSSNDFYLPSQRLEEGEGQHLVVVTILYPVEFGTDSG
jgi:hypothetical protein